MTSAAPPSSAGAPGAPHLAAAAAALVVVASILTAVHLFARQLEQRYVDTVAPSRYIAEKVRGIAIQRTAFARDDLLPVYGASEMTFAGRFDADHLFRNYPTGFRPFIVASSDATPLVMLERLGALGTSLRGKPLVITVTPTTFYRPQLERHSYAANFSPLQAAALALDSAIPYGLRQETARRMLLYPGTLDDDPILRWDLEALADPSWLGPVRYAALLPLSLIENAALGVCDHLRVISFVRRHRGLRPDPARLPSAIDWPSLEEAGARRAAMQAAYPGGANPFGFNGAYWNANRQHLVRTDARTTPVPEVPAVAQGLGRGSANLEWADLALLLDVLQALGARPLVVSAPMPGAFLDAWGVTAEQRAEYYRGLRGITSPRGVPLVDFFDHDEDRNFERDPLGHLTDRGWVEFDEVFDAFFHGAALPAPSPIMPASTPAAGHD